jgi:hypothetical protein
MIDRSCRKPKACGGECNRQQVGWAYGEWITVGGQQVWMCWPCQIKRRDAAKVAPVEPVQIPLTELAEFF